MTSPKVDILRIFSAMKKKIEEKKKRITSAVCLVESSCATVAKPSKELTLYQGTYSDNKTTAVTTAARNKKV